MKDPKPVDHKTARQLFIVGQIQGILIRIKREEHVDEGALNSMLDQVSVDLLREYLDTKPEESGFLYRKEIEQVIEMVNKKN